MRGSVLLTLTLSILLLGATSAAAQDRTSLVVDQNRQSQTEVAATPDAEVASTVVLAEPSAATINTRQDIQAAMLDVSAQNGDQPAAKLDPKGRRNLLYIVGGTLVAGGITAAIILLTGGDDDGIPAPPGRPAQ